LVLIILLYTLKGMEATLAGGPRAVPDVVRSGHTQRGAAFAAYVKGFAYLVAVPSVALLALTGFVPYLLSGESLAGFALVVHVFVAPIFSVCVTVLALLWTHEQRFDTADQRWLSQRIFGGGEGADTPARAPVQKICFWLLVLLAPLILGSIILSMYPVFGTSGQESLRTLHFASALAFLLVSLLHARLAARATAE
jgi:cytochrome b subunit of formate dehydrogenase